MVAHPAETTQADQQSIDTQSYSEHWASQTVYCEMEAIFGLKVTFQHDMFL
jgi:hypothetical protein